MFFQKLRLLYKAFFSFFEYLVHFMKFYRKKDIRQSYRSVIVVVVARRELERFGR